MNRTLAQNYGADAVTFADGIKKLQFKIDSQMTAWQAAEADSVMTKMKGE